MYLPNKRTFAANLIICCAVAFFVYFLKESALLEFLLAHALQSVARAALALAADRLGHGTSPLGLVLDAGCVVAAGALWTYLRSPVARLWTSGVSCLFLFQLAGYLYRSHAIILTAPLIVSGVMLAMAAETAAELYARQLRARIAGEKQEAEHGILGHLAHNVKPNVQIARSPIVAVLHFLEEKELTGEVLSRRLDGSNETVGDALLKAVASLEQIAGILENTRKLVTRRIPNDEFAEVALVPLIETEIAPLYADRVRIVVSGDRQLTVHLHRESFVEAVNNLVRNALTHAFAGDCPGPELRFALRDTRSRVIVDYTNNGRPFPENLDAKAFTTCGRKSNDSPGEGLGGAWIGKMVEAHHGSFEIIRDHHPLHFRITLPKRGI